MAQVTLTHEASLVVNLYPVSTVISGKEVLNKHLFNIVNESPVDEMH